MTFIPPKPHAPFPSPARMGWQCPRCNTVYSPEITTCGRCSINSIPKPIVPIPFPAFPPPYYTLRGGAVASANNDAVLWNSGCSGVSFLTEEKKDG